MQPRLIKRRFKAMGGPCEISIWFQQGQPEDVFEELAGELVRLEVKYSRFKSTSLLSEINRGEWNDQPFDDETTGLFNYAQECFELSGRLFDLTVGIFHKVWNYNSEALPKADQLATIKPFVGWQKLNWNGRQLNLPKGMQIDLGGLVKEFAADRLSQMLKDQSLSGLINLAGDISISETQPNKEPWLISVKHPRDEGPLAWIPLERGGIAGSGDYERFMEVDGQRYCHLLRPDTGYPAKNGLASVTVVADQCLLAGSISTVAMLKGEQGLDWLEEVGLPYLAIDNQLNTYGTISVQK